MALNGNLPSMSATLPLEPTGTCPDCGRPTRFIITTGGAGPMHLGDYNPETNTQTVSERCPGWPTWQWLQSD